MFKVTLSSNNEKQKIKMKKNALEYVDIESEKKLDPKYKTEMCKSWLDTGFCVYGNKCRFAHGKNELFQKPLGGIKYKQKDCNSFKQTGVCMYGKRCNFKHDERKLNHMERSFFTHLLSTLNFREVKNKSLRNKQRLEVFEKLSERSAETSADEASANTSTCSRSPANVKAGNIKKSYGPIYREKVGISGFVPIQWGIFNSQITNQSYYPCFQPLMTNNL